MNSAIYESIAKVLRGDHKISDTHEVAVHQIADLMIAEKTIADLNYHNFDGDIDWWLEIEFETSEGIRNFKDLENNECINFFGMRFILSDDSRSDIHEIRKSLNEIVDEIVGVEIQVSSLHNPVSTTFHNLRIDQIKKISYFFD